MTRAQQLAAGGALALLSAVALDPGLSAVALRAASIAAGRAAEILRRLSLAAGLAYIQRAYPTPAEPATEAPDPQ